MKPNSKRIITNTVLAGFLGCGFIVPFYNGVERRFLNESLSRYLGVIMLLLIFIQVCFLLDYFIKSLKTRQYIISVVFALLISGLISIGKMGLWITMMYFGLGAVGGH